MILRSIGKAQSLIFPLPGILTSGPSPLISPVSNSVTTATHVSASIATADSVLWPKSATSSAFREITTLPVKYKNNTFTNERHRKDKIVSKDTNTPHKNPKLEMSFHKQNKDISNEKENIQFEIPVHSNSHSFEEAPSHPAELFPTITPAKKAVVNNTNGEKSTVHINNTKEVIHGNDLEIISLKISNQAKGQRQTTDSHVETGPMFNPIQVSTDQALNLQIKKIVTHLMIIQYFNVN